MRAKTSGGKDESTATKKLNIMVNMDITVIKMENPRDCPFNKLLIYAEM